MKSTLPDSIANHNLGDADIVNVTEKSSGTFSIRSKKRLSGFFTFLSVAFLGIFDGYAQPTTLVAGDVALVGRNSANPDKFSVVLLKDINANTVIHFTDNGFLTGTTGRTGEGFLTYTAPSAQTKGTVLTWTNGQSISGTGWNNNAPTNFSFNASGDQLFIFQGTAANTQWANQSGITLIWGGNFGKALSSTSDAENTVQPSALTGNSFVNLGTAAYHNGYFANQSIAINPVNVTGTASAILGFIASSSNWVGTSGSAATFPTWNFTVQGSASITATGTPAAVNTVYGTPSSATSFQVSGSGLSANISVSPPSGFEVSKTSATSGFAATQSLTQSGGNVALTTVYVRLAATTPAGSYSGSIALASGTASASRTMPSSTVSAKALTVSDAVAQNKTYDKTAAAVITGATALGTVNGDVITLTGGGSFDDAFAGDDKNVTAALVAGGTNASSYTVTQPTGLQADIFLKDATLSAISVSDKPYDGTTEATLSATLDGVIAGDEVLLNPSANFASPFVGTEISVTSFSSLTGADAFNYNLVQPTGLSADITAKELSIAGATAQNKVYDGNTDAVITGTLEGVIAPDDVTLTLQGSFASPEVGLGIAVTSTSFISGDISNYTLVQPVGLTANISADALEAQTITFEPLADVTYGDAAFNLTATASSGLTVEYTSSDENVATIAGNLVTIHNMGITTITATQSGDLTYDAATPIQQTLNVLAKELTIASASAQNKVYDGNASATITGTLQGVVASDEVVLTTSGAFATPSVGIAIEVTSTSFITGSDISNYILTQPSGLSADITAKELTVENATAADKTYDATTSTTISGGDLIGVINADDVSLSGFEGTFASANVGDDIDVTTNFSLTGSAAANYSLTQPTDLFADITAASVTIFGLAAENKTYDGNTDASVSGTPMVDGVIGSDDVVVSGTSVATFNNKNAGTAKPVTVTGLTLAGSQAGNYSINEPISLSADINAASLAITDADAQDKTFDGTNAAVITGTLSGVISPDVVTLVGTGTFASSAVGNNIAVTSTATLGGADGTNYIIDPQPTGLVANILPAPAVLANWTYEPVLNGPSNPTPNTGTGTSGIVGSMGTPGTGNGMTGTGCGNQTSGTTAFAIGNAAPGTNESSGARFSTSTAGYQNIKFSWDQRCSNTAANTMRLQYTLNGTTWTNFTMTAENTTFCLGSLNNGRFENSASGDVYRRISVDLSSIAEANDNAAFGVRVVAAHYQNTGQFRQTNTPASIATGGTWRFDNVKFEGTEIPVSGPSSAVLSGSAAICNGNSATLNVVIVGGTEAYTVTYNDGTSDVTLENYISGLNISVSPSANTTYTLISVTDANSLPATEVSGTATITVNQFYDFYVDGDSDGYGAGNAVSLCSTSAAVAPAGHSVNNDDCNDEVAAVNPGAAEVPYNGIDDDCDGTIDEGSQLLSKVLASQCGTTLTTINSLIGAVSFGAPVDGYRFEVTDTETELVQTIDRAVPNFQLTALASYDYARTYSIRVMLKRNNIWLNYYGDACLVSTPAILDEGGAASVTPSQCGIVLPSISTLIATTSLQGVTGYRFRITNTTDASAPNQVQTLDRVVHWFSLTMLSTFAYGTTYTVEVSVKTNGAYSGYGSPCTVSTPAVPVITNPGTAASANSVFYTTSMNRATSYRFELTLLQEPFTTIVIDRPNHYFSFSQVPGYVPGATYGVRVAVMTSGAWSLYGEAEPVTAPGGGRGIVKDEQETIAAVDFRAVGYPNPYLEGFSIDMDSASDERITVKVYDMVGKLLDNREFTADAIEMQQFGERYPSGVYNVIVTQGEFVKTLRMIKR